MPPADLSLVKLESDGILRVKIPHGHIDLDGTCPTGVAPNMRFALNDMKDVGDFDHLIIGNEISGQGINWHCDEPATVNIHLGNIILKEGAGFSRTKPQVVKPQREVNLSQRALTPLGDYRSRLQKPKFLASLR